MYLQPTWRDRALRSACAALVVSLALATPAALHSQQAPPATVTGRVTASGTGEPLGDTRVMVAGTGIATNTTADGHYTLHNVAPGTAEIRVIRVGYQEQKKPVVVTAGDAATLDFTMAPAVVQLQEIVSTATGEQRKVELGNAISTISATQHVEESATNNLADLLVAKAPGVSVLPGNMTGSAPVIRIRGLNSLSLSNAPVMIVDGVRYYSSSIGGGVGGTNISFMNSLNPEEIEDIEIVKGPSAATLYGTDAANGVIVVTTKKGRAGTTRWTWFADASNVDDRNNYPSTYAIWGHKPNATKATRCELATMGPSTCIEDSVTSINVAADPAITPLAMGRNSNYGGQVSGGSDQVRYFVSSDLFNEVGPYHMPTFAQQWLADSALTAPQDDWVHPEAFQRENMRANLSAAVNPRFDLNVNAGFSKTDQRLPQVDNNVNGIGGAMYLTYGTDHAGLDYNPVGALGEDLHGYARYTPATIFQYLTEQGLQRMTGSGDAQWRPFDWMQNDATVGIDLADQSFFDLCAFNECPVFGSNRLGFVEDDHTNNRYFTAKLVSNSTWQYRPWANFKTTLGSEYINNENDGSTSKGATLPPGAQTVGSGAVLTASDVQPTATKTLGIYVQEQASLRDRIFVTGAVRTDQNSAFGAQFERVFYPKLSLSWILSDEPFFPQYHWMNSFRLRSAYGASGVQPGATAALRTFRTSTIDVNNVDTPGLRESALGNPDLKPETSAEFESGFESRVLSNKVNIDFTYYHKQTHDALITLPIAPSAAPSATSVTANLASVRNSGLETTINASILDRRRFGWDVTLSASHNSNAVVSLGNDPTGKPNKTIGTGATRDSVGLPVDGVFVRPVVWSDANHDGVIQASEVTVDTGYVYDGYSVPRDIVSLQNGFDFFNRKLRISALLDYKGGFNLFNNTMEFICQQSPQSCDEDEVASMPLWRQARAVAQNYGTTVNGTKYTSTAAYWENGQFWRLRELSATVQMPQALASRLRARDANLVLSGRNLHVWTKYTEVDPESNYSTGDVQTDFLTTAPRTYFEFRLNLHY